MYKCDNCSKEYSSQKRYINHVETCGINKRSSTRSSGFLTDNEIDRSHDRSKEYLTSDLSQGKLDKLMKEKMRYKLESKKYKNELDNLIQEHRVELENSKLYLQQQILQLTEEKEELSYEIQDIRKNIFTEKDKLRKEYTQKLNMEKSRLESTYDDKNLISSELQSTIQKLEVRLIEEVEGKDRMKQEYENIINIMKNKHLQETEELQSELRNIRINIEKERQEAKKSVQLYKDDKETVISMLKRQKEQEINDVCFKKDSIIATQKNSINTLKNDIENIEKEYTKQINNLKCSNELLLTQKNQKIEKLTLTYNQQLNQQKTHHDEVVEKVRNNMTNEMNKCKEQHKNELYNKEKSFNISINNTKQSYTREIESLKSTIDKLGKTIEESKVRHQEHIKNVNDEFNKKLADKDKIIYNNIQLTTSLQQQYKEISSKYEIDIEKIYKNLDNATKTIQTLEKQLSNVKTTEQNKINDITMKQNEVVSQLKLEIDKLNIEITNHKQKLIEQHQEHTKYVENLTNQYKNIQSTTQKQIEDIKLMEKEKASIQIADIIGKQELQESILQQKIEKLMEELKDKEKNIQKRIDEEKDILRDDEKEKCRENIRNILTRERDEQQQKINEMIKKEEERYNKILDENKVMMDQNKKLTDELEVEKKEVARIMSFVAKKDLELKTTTKSNNNNTLELKVLKEKHDNCDSTIKKLEAKLSETTNKLMQVSKEHIQLQTHIKQQNNTKETTDKNIIQEYEDKINLLKENYNVMEKKLRTNLNETTIKLRTIQENYEKISNELKNINGEQNNIHSTQDQELNKLKNMIKTHNTEKENLQKQLKTLRDENEVINNKYNNIKEEHDNISRNYKIDNDIDLKMKKMREEHLESLRKHKNEVTETKIEIAKLKREMSMLQSQIDMKEQEINNMINNKKVMESSYLNNLNAQKDTFSVAMSDKDGEISRLKSRINELDDLLAKTIRKIAQ